MTLNKLHQSRWNFAKNLTATLKEKAKEKNAVIFFQGDEITNDQLVVTEYSIYVKDGNCVISIFEADPEFDHGLYKTSKKFEADFRNQFHLYIKETW